MKMRSLTNFFTLHLPASAKVVLPVLGMGFLLLLSCKSASQPGQQQPAETMLHFQKTTCFGSCPAYQATIATDGSVIFAGFAHVPSTDTLTFILSTETLDSLTQAIRELDYTSLKDIYPTQWSDMPATISTFYKDGKEIKKVRHLEGGPEKLIQYQEWLDKILLKEAAKKAVQDLPKE